MFVVLLHVCASVHICIRYFLLYVVHLQVYERGAAGARWGRRRAGAYIGFRVLIFIYRIGLIMGPNIIYIIVNPSATYIVRELRSIPP